MVFLRVLLVLIFGLSFGCQTKKNKAKTATPPKKTTSQLPPPPAEEDAFAKSVEVLKQEPMNFHKEFLDFKQAIADYKKSKSYLDPKTDQEVMMKMEADNMDKLTEEFLVEQIRQNKFESYNAKLKDMDKIIAQTEEVIEKNFVDPTTSETTPTPGADGGLAPVVAGTTEEEQVEVVEASESGAVNEIGDETSSTAADKKDNKRTSLQIGTGIFSIIMGTLGVVVGGVAVAVGVQNKAKAAKDSNAAKIKEAKGVQGVGAVIGLLSLAAVIMGSLVVADENKNKVGVTGMQVLMGIPAAASGLLAVGLIGAGGYAAVTAAKGQLMKSGAPLIIGAGLLFAGLTVGLGVWINDLKLADQYNDVETFQSKTARLYVIASHMDENNMDPRKPMPMPAQ